MNEDGKEDVRGGNSTTSSGGSIDEGGSIAAVR